MRSPEASLTVLATLTAFAAAVMFAATTVTVEDGDTLSAIAVAHDVAIVDVVAWNDIDDPDRIFSGDVLVVSAPGPADAASPSGSSHVVTAGETLSSIAARYGATVAVLVEANRIDDPDHIRAGATLLLATSTSQASAAPGTTPASHVVLPGETLWSIATDHGLSVAALAAQNELDDADHIVSGQALVLGGRDADEASPGAVESTTTTTTAPATTTTTAPDPEPEAAPPPEAVVPQPSLTQTPLADAFERWSTSYGVPRDLLEAIAWHASDWQPAITGPDGRLGIGQLTPEAVELVETRLLGLDLDPLATSDGVRLAARYLRYLIDRTHSDRQALIAWQVGLSAFLDGTSSAEAEAWAETVAEIRRMRA